MKRFPVFGKKFSDLLPWARRVSTTARKLFLRTAVTGMGALALAPALPSSTVGPEAAPNPVAVAVLNRDKRSKAGKLVLHLNNAFDSVMRAAHRSHSSHSSHRSHSSHSSHSSHYSSSRGTAPSSPSPSPSPSSPPPSREPAPLYQPPAGSDRPGASSDGSTQTVPYEGKLEKAVITIKKIDLEKMTITGKTPTGVEMSFLFLPLTQVQQLSSTEPSRSIADFQAVHPGSFPVRLEQQIMVEWKFDWNTNQRLAIKLTTL